MARTLTYNEMKQTLSELEKDLLAYKRATETAVKAKDELAHIFTAVPDHIAAIDRQYRIKRVNKSLADKLKCTQEALIGALCYKYICMADSPPSSCPHARMLGDGKEHFAEIYIQQLGMNLQVTSSPLYDEKGKLIGGVLVAREIMKHKSSENT